MIKAFTDGCRKATGLGGWAYIIHHKDKTYFKGGFLEDVTNNEAELHAVTESIGMIFMMRDDDEYGTICSDSSYFVNGYNDWMEKWKKRGWTRTSGPKGVKIANLIQWQMIHEYSLKMPNITALWTKGHAGHKENEWCDLIANFCHDNQCGINGVININEFNIIDLSKYKVFN